MMKQSKGITLVALILTIIVLLILAGISIQAITNTGIFTQANNAKRESEIANIKEQIALDIYEKQLAPPVGSITEDQLKTILEKHGTIIYEEDGVTIKGITTEKGYEILLKDIYGGETVAETVPESVPDGAIVTPINDITTWLKTGEISKQYSYTTIEEVIADSTCTESLMKNENVMKYLERSTEFADAICASETAMTYLGDSAYVDDTALNNDTWVEKVKQSPYWQNIANISVVIYGGASETITIAGLYNSPQVITNSDGSVSYSLIKGSYTFTGSVSGQSFTRIVENDTTDVYVMPTGALYWYGNECTDVTGGWKRIYRTGFSDLGYMTKDTNTITNGKSYGHAYSYVTVKNPILRNDYQKIRVLCKNDTGTNYVNVQTLKSNIDSYDLYAFKEISVNDLTYSIIDLDISAIEQSMYPAIQVWGGYDYGQDAVSVTMKYMIME